ncbi:sodium/proton-translocating pyrophosphatase [Flavisolibacter ginsenosidimutans]|uniref:sodium/proton-translocating pyrophosphatase n=1 Tax=Flavisolibacter ginsenosidimutans TaxID=661481 RepID=UPI0021D19C0D|nr:sodium/proton-translocating pyrophosphatase [Flavisolibacter ginsenosidimutans]
MHSFESYAYLVPVMGLIGLLYTLWKFSWVSKQDAGTDRMKEISTYIAEGAMAFLKAEWKILTYFGIIVALLLGFMGYTNKESHWSIAIAFIIGAFFSALAGYIGMRAATKANVRTAHAARTSLSKALQVSFTGGAVMGMGVAGLAVLGLGGLFIVLLKVFASGALSTSHEVTRAIEVLTGFSLGAESIALFARVGGGIYTKAADVGADLVGKVEAGIPEDDPRNPATIADNVGDNVGDVAGMGADLFGSYVATVLATIVLGHEVVNSTGTELSDGFSGFSPILLPMLIAGVGILFSIIGTFFVRISENAGIHTSVVQKALNMGNWGSIVLTAVASYFLCTYLLPSGDMYLIRDFANGSLKPGIEGFTSIKVFGAIAVGLVVGTLMSIITEFYTAMGKRPVLSIVRQSGTGHATTM